MLFCQQFDFIQSSNADGSQESRFQAVHSQLWDSTDRHKGELVQEQVVLSQHGTSKNEPLKRQVHHCIYPTPGDQMQYLCHSVSVSLCFLRAADHLSENEALGLFWSTLDC